MFILDDDELFRLTGKKQNAAQCAELRKMGVRFRERLDGKPIVVKESVIEYLGIDAPKEERATIKFEAVNG